MPEFSPLLPIFDYLRELNTLSIIARLLVATLCGSVIGFERGKKRHAAGLRTHIIVCIGAASVMIVNQYISTFLAPGSDPARMGAQVISGIGFLGAGTIMITGNHRGRHVKGLTTAAGLWASACMGLSAGIGFYEGALLMCLFLFAVMVILNRLDQRYFKSAKSIQLYVEYETTLSFGIILKSIRQLGWHMTDFDYLGANSGPSPGSAAVIMDIHSENKNTNRQEVLDLLRSRSGVLFAEEV